MAPREFHEVASLHVQKFYDGALTMVKPRLYLDFDQEHG